MYKESESLELKKSLAQLKEGIISLSSMLNKRNEGKLLFGINDDGKVFGVMIGKKTIADITHEIQNNLKPLPLKLSINEIEIEDRKIIEVIVEGQDTPYSAYGRYYIRINDADIMMDSSQLQHFFESKEESYINWEQNETKYTVDDIDENLLIDCIRRANENGRLNYVYRNAQEALNKFGLLTDNGKLNNAGLYLFGNNKPLTIKEANYPTDSNIEFGDIRRYKGNIFECINESTNYIQNLIYYKSTVNGLQREDKPEIPIKAIREIVVNSFAHCSYAKVGDTNSYIVTKSQIKIYNPGSILRNIDPKRFASGIVGSKIRNVLISQVLYDCGYIDAFGTGFNRTFTLCANDSIEYKYTNDEFGFTFIFIRKDDFFKVETNKKEKDIVNKISDLDRKIIKSIKENKFITIPEISFVIEKSEPTVHRHLDKLMKLKVIRRIGSRKNGYWEKI